MAYKKSKEKSTNPWDYSMHFTKIKKWYRDMIKCVADENGELLKEYGETIGYKANGEPIIEEFYVLQFNAPLWMILVHEFLRLTLASKQQDYIFYGNYNHIKGYICESFPKEYRPSLKRALNDTWIRNSIRRAAESGFLIVEYDEDVDFQNKKEMNATGKHFRSIRVNHDKIIELSEFFIDNDYKLKDNKEWNKYHRCSREHKWMKKRVISSMLKINKQLEDKERKDEFRKKLAALNLKLKGGHDILKVFVITKQKNQFEPNDKVHENLTALKSKKVEDHKAPPGVVITEEQSAMLNDFYRSIKC